MAQWNPILFMHHVRIICSFADGHLGWFYFLALVKRRGRNMDVTVSRTKCTFRFLLTSREACPSPKAAGEITDTGQLRGLLRPSTPALKQQLWDWQWEMWGTFWASSSLLLLLHQKSGSELIKKSSAWQGGNSTDALQMPSASDGDTDLQSTGDTKPTLCCPRLGMQSTKSHHDCP